MGKWHGGKGDKQRPVDPKKWDENYERIFGKKKKADDSAEGLQNEQKVQGD